MPGGGPEALPQQRVLMPYEIPPSTPSKGERPALDRQWLTLIQTQGISAFLQGPLVPPATLQTAVQQFNEGQYWRCHETLEEIWLVEGYPVRLFYQALLKSAVGLLHMERRNRKGSLSKLRDARTGLEPFTPSFMGINTGTLLSEVVSRIGLLEGDSMPDWADIEARGQVHLLPSQSPE